MKKKVLYLTEWEMHKGDGIFKKIESQLIAMNEIADVNSLYINQRTFKLNNHVVRYKFCYFNRISKFVQVYKVIKKNRYDYVYVRNIAGFNSILFFIVTLFINKSQFIIEIPTYPFDSESKYNLSKLLFKTVRCFYRYTVSYITYMGESSEKIWGINAIRLDNAVSVADYKIKKLCDVNSGDCFHMIGVSSLAFWHGYDRIIKSISASECNAIFHIVGNGPELKKLKSMADKLGVSNSVKFYGRLDGYELDCIFDMAHIAVDSLGRHRSGNNENSSIKSKEYSARGIPFIKSHVDSVFEGCKFVQNVSPDESLVDLDSLRQWYENLEVSPDDIRRFAINNLQWSKQMEKLPFNRGI